MKIVFYTTRSDAFNGDYVRMTYEPRRALAWDELAAAHPEHEIVVAGMKPGNALFDMEGSQISERPKNVQYVELENGLGLEEVADVIADLQPDAAVAVSGPGQTLDWNPVMDSMIAEVLEQRGIRAVAHRVFTSMACFDKWRSNMMLRSARFDVARSLYVHNDIFRVEETIPSISTNVYKEYVLRRIRDMEYPVIIKSTTGAGSAGIQIADTFEDAAKVLLNENNNADVLVEEMLPGEQFGTEIHVTADGQYNVLPPFALSTNEAGITDPYTGAKFGPVTDEAYSIRELQETLRRMAMQFGFRGSTEIDLVYRNNKWSVIEINPRWSGLTTTAAAAQDRSPLEIYMETVTGGKKDYSDPANLKPALNFKVRDLSPEDAARLAQFEGVKYVGSTIAEVPGRDRVAFSEVVMGGFDTKQELRDAFERVRDAFPDNIPDQTIRNVESLFEKYEFRGARNS